MAQHVADQSDPNDRDLRSINALLAEPLDQNICNIDRCNFCYCVVVSSTFVPL